MRKFNKIFLAFAVSALLISALLAAPAYASSTASKLFDYSSILAPGQPMPTPAPEPEPPPVYRNPHMSYIPYAYVKGGVKYNDFADLPDFGQYAQMGGDKIAVYPAYERSFYFVGAPEIIYTYRSRIIDYLYVNAGSLKNYKSFIKSLGFEQRKNFESAPFPEYIDIINEELKYDPDFTADDDGIFIIEDLETFWWLLIGKSIAYDAAGKLAECVEFRFYSLTRSDIEEIDILHEAGELNDAEDISGQSVSLFTPLALNDIADILSAPSQGLLTPNALNDIINVNNPPPLSGD